MSEWQPIETAPKEVNDEGLPIIPPLQPHPPRTADGAIAICGACGLRIMPVMGYCCPRSDCPVFPVVTC